MLIAHYLRTPARLTEPQQSLLKLIADGVIVHRVDGSTIWWYADPSRPRDLLPVATGVVNSLIHSGLIKETAWAQTASGGDGRRGKRYCFLYKLELVKAG